VSFRNDLKRFLDETTPTICPVCGLNGANYDSALGHVAWTHQKIRELLTPGTVNFDLFSILKLWIDLTNEYMMI
jgi:hypothetical protein